MYTLRALIDNSLVTHMFVRNSFLFTEGRSRKAADMIPDLESMSRVNEADDPYGKVSKHTVVLPQKKREIDMVDWSSVTNDYRVSTQSQESFLHKREDEEERKVEDVTDEDGDKGGFKDSGYEPYQQNYNSDLQSGFGSSIAAGKQKWGAEEDTMAAASAITSEEGSHDSLSRGKFTKNSDEDTNRTTEDGMNPFFPNKESKRNDVDADRMSIYSSQYDKSAPAYQTESRATIAGAGRTESNAKGNIFGEESLFGPPASRDGRLASRDGRLASRDGRASNKDMDLESVYNYQMDDSAKGNLFGEDGLFDARKLPPTRDGALFKRIETLPSRDGRLASRVGKLESKDLDLVSVYSYQEGRLPSRDGRLPTRDGAFGRDEPPPSRGGRLPTRDGGLFGSDDEPPPSRGGRAPSRDGRTSSMDDEPPPSRGGRLPTRDGALFSRDGRAPSRDGRSPIENRDTIDFDSDFSGRKTAQGRRGISSDVFSNETESTYRPSSAMTKKQPSDRSLSNRTPAGDDEDDDGGMGFSL